ncbi:hypothetical protein B0A55_00415 [Friedmanniomyces simplex]|uniref:Secondary thiamine-phosphate synthase enzyme n=1 Tax=Friedmanniomyces simplex TaxID=329884 RepID=A0A4U0Y4X2_9PEZI|nr:hypothetical protein B0A55_00415 [Friedmanniomyces simplex]
MPFDTNLRNTVIFLVIFILAFFPSLFHILLKPLLLPLEYLSGTVTREPYQLVPTCACCPPASCYPPPATAPYTAAKAKEKQHQQQPEMAWSQKHFALPSKGRGSHLITDYIIQQLPEIKTYQVGLLHLFVQHTSCALSLNENYDSDVRADMSEALDRLAPEDRKGDLYRHSAEGLDDMPAHVKSSLVGASVTVPISNGALATGTWQGVWFLEFRDGRQSRRVVATIQGEKKG